MSGVMERFAAKVVVAASGCWEWTASHSTSGYARLAVGKKIERASRVSYELFVGRIPDGLQIDHLCRNRGCVNPAHLEPVTGTENIHRSPLNPIHRSHCPAGHPYAGANLIVQRKRGRTWQRFCRECKNAKRRQARAAA